MKSDKTTLLQSVDGVKTEPNLDVEFKKEPVLNTSLCENETKNSNLCSKVKKINLMYLIFAFKKREYICSMLFSN